MDIELNIDTYTELGVSVSDTEDGSSSAVIGGDTVDESTLGTYIVTYDATDSNGNHATQVTRTVNVVDTTIPVITLNGASTITLVRNLDTYTEPGASVSDNDPSTSSTVIGGDDVDTSVAGTYIITYNVSDPSGNSATQVTRTVNIVNPPSTHRLGGSLDPGSEPSVSGFTYSGPTVSDGGIGFGALLNLDPNKPFTNVIPVGEPSEIILKLSNLDGATHMEHVSMYFLNQGTSPVDWKDTSITWDKFKGTTVIDPTHLLSDVSIKSTQIAGDMQYTVHFTFNDEMKTSDILIKGWNIYKNTIEQRYSNAIQVVNVPSGTPTTIIEQENIKQVSLNSATPTSLENGIAHLTQLGIIRVSSDSKQSVTVPHWYENVIMWWQNGQISEDDFVASSTYLLRHNVLQVI